MKRSILVSMVAMSLWACGPDGVATVEQEDSEVDGLETYDAELTSTSRSQTWLPLASGNSWRYRSAAGAGRTITVQQMGENMALVSGLYAQPIWLGMSSATGTTLNQWANSKWEPLVRFGYSTTTWKTNTTVCKGLVGKRASTGTTFITPAGRFTDTRTIAFAQVSTPSTMCAAPAFTELTFVPNVGLVSFKTGTNLRYNLVSATLGGVEFPADPDAELTAKVVLDKASYVSLPNTIQCITTPCPGNAQTADAKVELQLKNTGSTSASWQFATGCQFDVELVSSTGRVVRRLSDTRTCSFATSSLTLGAGQSKVFAATLPLADKEGLQLSGTYTVRAKLIPSSNASTAPSATGSFQVTVLAP